MDLDDFLGGFDLGNSEFDSYLNRPVDCGEQEPNNGSARNSRDKHSAISAAKQPIDKNLLGDWTIAQDFIEDDSDGEENFMGERGINPLLGDTQPHADAIENDEASNNEIANSENIEPQQAGQSASAVQIENEKWSGINYEKNKISSALDTLEKENQAKKSEEVKPKATYTPSIGPNKPQNFDINDSKAFPTFDSAAKAIDELKISSNNSSLSKNPQAATASTAGGYRPAYTPSSFGNFDQSNDKVNISAAFSSLNGGKSVASTGYQIKVPSQASAKPNQNGYTFKPIAQTSSAPTANAASSGYAPRTISKNTTPSQQTSQYTPKNVDSKSAYTPSFPSLKSNASTSNKPASTSNPPPSTGGYKPKDFNTSTFGANQQNRGK